MYPNFITAFGGKIPSESLVIAAGAEMIAVDSANGWAAMDNSYFVAEKLNISMIGGRWVEFSKYENVNFTEIYAADLDLFYFNIMRAGDYSDFEIAIMKQQYPEYAYLLDVYGRDPLC